MINYQTKQKQNGHTRTDCHTVTYNITRHRTCGSGGKRDFATQGELNELIFLQPDLIGW